MSGNAFRGVSAEQDARFGNKEKKLLKTMAKTFPPEYSVKVDMSKINWEAMKVWIAKRLTDLLGGVEDDVLIGYVFEQLEGKKDVDPRLLQINLTGFLEKNTSLFCKELWNLLISAASNPSGIPQKFLDEKAAELQARNAERQRMQERLHTERSKQEVLRADYAAAGDRGRKSRWDTDAPRPESRGREEKRRGRSRSRSHSRDHRKKRKSRSLSPSPSRSSSSPSRSPSRERQRRHRDRRSHSGSRDRRRYGDRSRSRSRSRYRQGRRKRRSPSYDPYQGK